MNALIAFFIASTTQTIAGTPTFFEMASDKPDYSTGEKAVFSTYVKVQPENPDYEIHLEAVFDGAAIKVIRFSSSQAASISPVLANGAHEYRVKAYLQNASEAASYTTAIEFYEKEICDLERQLTHETDPAKIAELQATIARDQATVIQLKALLSDARRLVEEKSLTIGSNSAAHKALNLFFRPHGSSGPFAPLSDQIRAFEFTADRTLTEYAVNEQARVEMHLNVDLIGEDGPVFAFFRAALDDERLHFSRLSDQDYAASTAPFPANKVGLHAISATLSVISKAVANSITGAIRSAEKMRADLILLRDRTTDPDRRKFLQEQIDDLTTIIDDRYRAFSENTHDVQTKEILLRVQGALK